MASNKTKLRLSRAAVAAGVIAVMTISRPFGPKGGAIPIAVVGALMVVVLVVTALRQSKRDIRQTRDN